MRDMGWFHLSKSMIDVEVMPSKTETSFLIVADDINEARIILCSYFRVYIVLNKVNE
jgi:hypothetical protein